MNTEKPFLQFETPEFTTSDIDSALEEDRIDENDAQFLRNTLNGLCAGEKEVLKEILTYRTRLNNGLKPGQERFILMQELGCKSHPHTGINIVACSKCKQLILKSEAVETLIDSSGGVNVVSLECKKCSKKSKKSKQK